MIHLELTKSLICGSIPIVTLRRTWDFDLQRIQDAKANCPICGHCFCAPESVLKTIYEITSKAGLKPEELPCHELPDGAWESPGLLTNCPKCGEVLKFNPFIAGGD